MDTGFSAASSHICVNKDNNDKTQGCHHGFISQVLRLLASESVCFPTCILPVCLHYVMPGQLLFQRAGDGSNECKSLFWPKTINTLPALAALYDRLTSEIIKMGMP